MGQFCLFGEGFLEKILTEILLAGLPGLDYRGRRMLFADRYQAYLARVPAGCPGRLGDSFVDAS